MGKRATVCVVRKIIQFIPVLRLLGEKNVKSAQSISGNHPVLGPLNFFCDASHSLFTALSFCLSETLLSSTAKIAVALLCPFSYAH
jgi:hypothetical protein